jgi:bifunctional UDP-N-acetylglucosamine pyrophosphorylase / glucosamine-1-phosphate N-acetyltransferase
MGTPLAAIVLCAGMGERMKSARAKVLQPLLGRNLCDWPIAAAFEAGATKVVAIVGHQADSVRAGIEKSFPGQPVKFGLQAQQKGTGDAVAAAREALAGFDGPVFVLYGDVPLLTTDTLKKLVAAYDPTKGPLALVSARPPDPFGYGRLVREGGSLRRVVEEKDCTAEQRRIDEVNAGIYLADAKFLMDAVGKLSPKNAKGELYLTDIVEQAAARGAVAVVEAPVEETAGVNNKAELARAAKVLQQRINRGHMLAGVTMADPDSTYIEATARLAADVSLAPQVSIGAGCELAANVRVGQGSVLKKAKLGADTEVLPYSVLDDVQVGQGCSVGPFARLRPGTVLEDGVHVGNFVETKKAKLGKGTKASHLTYLGDAVIGQGTNVGAGTITCNYDGVNKHQTTIGDNVFVGSDTQLVAPVSVGDGAIIAAGTTVTRNVPANALVLSRAPQTIKENWAETRKKVLGREEPR